MLYKTGCTPLEYAATYMQLSQAEAAGEEIPVPGFFELLADLSGDPSSVDELRHAFEAATPEELLGTVNDDDAHILKPFVSASGPASPPPAEGFDSKTITLRIQLDGMKKPPLYRVVKVPGGISFAALHSIIRIVMGWEGGHLHAFRTPNGTSIGHIDEEDDMNYMDEDYTFISSYLNSVGTKLKYEYDFGDGWEHTIKVEAIDDTPSEHPVLIKTKGGQVVEDCGGIWGLQELRDIVASTGRISADAREQMEWLGAANRVELAAMVTAEIDIDEVNEELAEF